MHWHKIKIPLDFSSGICVGKTGFEPATPWSQTRCATGLRYFPNPVIDSKLSMFLKR